MKDSISNQLELNQDQTEEKEYYVILRFTNGLAKNIKNRIKSSGCVWSILHRGWICPAANQEEILRIIKETDLNYEAQIIAFPRGIISLDSKIANKKTRLEILEQQHYDREIQLLQAVYLYNNSLRPQDFAEKPHKEGKSAEELAYEFKFHEEWIALQHLQTEIKILREELFSNPNQDEKVFDPRAPLRIAETLIAEKFFSEGQRTLHFCADAFWGWEKSRYVELDKEEIRRIVYNLLGIANKRSKQGTLMPFNPTKSLVDQVIDALRATCHIKHMPASRTIWLDGRAIPNPKQLIAFQNGLLNVNEWPKDQRTGLLSHSPSYFNTNALSFNFESNLPEPNEWLQFLYTIWPDDQESIASLQEWMGYLLTHDTRQHKILLIVGPPRSGKGTIGRILHELLGPNNVVGPTLSSLGGEFGLQPLLYKTLAIISDARLNMRGNNSLITERLLSISGEDPLTINRKFLDPITVQLITRMMIMTNELPNLKDASGALAKRYLLLMLRRSWLGQEDPDLFYRLRAELASILLWALQGLQRLLVRGRFLQPESALQDAAELEAMTSPMLAFISENCRLNPVARIAISKLFESWQEWCSNGGFHAVNIQTFGKDLRAALPQIEMIRPQNNYERDRYYKGLALIEK